MEQQINLYKLKVSENLEVKLFPYYKLNFIYNDNLNQAFISKG